MDTYEGRRRRHLAIGSAVAGAAGLLAYAYRHDSIFRSKANQWIHGAAENVVSRLVSASERYVDKHIGMRHHYGLEATFSRYLRDYAAPAGQVADRMEQMARRHLVSDVVSNLFHEKSNVVQSIASALPSDHRFSGNARAVSEFIQRELIGTGTRVGRLARARSVQQTLHHSSFAALHRELGTQGVQEISSALKGLPELLEQSISKLQELGAFERASQRMDERLSLAMKARARAQGPWVRRLRGLGIQLDTADRHVLNYSGQDTARTELYNYLKSSVGNKNLSHILWSPKLTFRSGREYDLSPVMQAYSHMVQWARHSISVPIAPGLASISPFRLFPWREEFTGMVAHLQHTSRQGQLSALINRQAGSQLGEDVLLIGDRALTFRFSMTGDIEKAIADPKSAFHAGGLGVRYYVGSVEGKFGAYSIRGQALRDVSMAMTGARDAARARGVLDVPQTALGKVIGRFIGMDNPAIKWLGLDRPLEADWLTHKISAFTWGSDPNHPLSLLRKFPMALAGKSSASSPELISDVRRLSSFMRYNTRIDVDYAINRVLDYYDELSKSPGQNQAVLNRLNAILGKQHTVSTGINYLKLLRIVKSRESTVEALLQGQRGSGGLSAAYLSTLASDPTTPEMLGNAIRELLHNPGFAQMDKRIHSSHLASEMVDNLLGIATLRDSVDRFREGVLISALRDDLRTGGNIIHDIFPTRPGRRMTQIVTSKVQGFQSTGRLSFKLGELVDIHKDLKEIARNEDIISLLTAHYLHDISEASNILAADIEPILNRVFFHGDTYRSMYSTLRRTAGGLRQWMAEGDLDIGDNLIVLRKLDPIRRFRKGYRKGRVDVLGTLENMFTIGRSMFTTDPKAMTMASVPSHFFALRLNQMLVPYGLGLPEHMLRTPGEAYGNLLLRRIAPAVALWEGFRLLDYLMHAATRTSISSMMGTGLGMYAQGIRSVQDALRITPVLKWVANLIPGSDLYFNPKDREEERMYQQYGFAPIRRGRWWLLGSRSPFHGENVEAYYPHLFRRMRSHWQAASNVDLMGRDWLLHQWWFNPVLAIGDPDWWVRKHRKDRPYPVGGRMLDVYSSVGAIAGIADPAVVKGDVRSLRERAEVQKADFERLMLSTLITSPLYRPMPASMKTYFVTEGGSGARSGRLRGIAARIKRGRGAIRAQLEEFGIEAPGLRDGTVPVYYPYDPVFRVAGAARAVGELQGIYGWIGSLFTRPRTVLRWDDPGWAMSRSRQFWEARFGGLDPIPMVGELNEFIRRFLLRREASDVRVNPLPNNMPAWLPGDYSPSVNFRRGDPYTKVIRGELRLPGEAYRLANPNVFRRDLLAARASMLGKSRREMFETFFGLSSMEGDTGGFATIYGTRVHKKIQTELMRQGLLAEEEREYRDPQHNIYGHPDLVLRDAHGRRLIGEIKTMSARKFAQRRIFYEHYIQLQQYLHMTHSRRGILIYVNRDDPSQIRQFKVRYNPFALRRAWNRLQSVRSDIKAAMHRGEINEGALYSDLVRFEILSDVAPFSPIWRTYQKVLESRFVNDPGEVTSVDQYRYQSAMERAELRRKSNLTYAYRTGGLKIGTYEVERVTETGLIYLRGVDRPIRPAGVHLNYVRLARLMSAGGITVDEQYRAIGIDTGKRSRRERQRRAEVLRRLRETNAGMRARGITVSQLYRAYGIYSGARIRISTNQPLRSTLHSPAEAVIGTAGTYNVSKLMVAQGVARFRENIDSPEAYQARFNIFHRMLSKPIEFLVHRDTPIHNKLFRVRSPVEEYERSHVYGTRSSAWEHPFRSFVYPTITGILAKNPIQAFLYGGFVSSLLFSPTQLKLKAALVGGSLMAMGSLWVHLRMWFGKETWKPKRVRKREEIEEYYDYLTYLKYRMLYLREAREAKRREHVDIDRLLRKLGRYRKRGIRAAMVRTGIFHVSDVRPIKNGRIPYEPVELRFHAQKALLYRALYEKTLIAQTDLSHSPSLAAIPKDRRELILETAEYGTANERRRLYRMLPAHERRVVGHLLLGRKGKTSYVAMERAMRRFQVPDKYWAGWKPEVDLEMLKIRTYLAEGLDPIDAGVSSREVRIAEVVTRNVELPVYHSSYQSPAYVRTQLNRLALDLGADWYDVRSIRSSGRLVGSPGIVRFNVERDTTGYLQEQIDALEY